MNNKGIPRIWLVIIVLIAVLAVGTIVAIAVIGASGNQKSGVNDIQEPQQNIIENTKTEDYTKLDEGIAKQELPKVARNVIATTNSTIDGRIPCFYNPVIPEGFKAIGIEEDKTIDINAKWGEQNAYLYGLVIGDKNGNQFVWIPIENMNIFKTTDWQKNAPKEIIDSTYTEPTKEDEEEYYTMYYKVKKYGGFYVGRYETGDLTAQVPRDITRNADSIGVRKYLNVYNYVPFKLSTINKREIIGAQELAIKFGEQNEYKTVKTSVMYGVQWDSMLRFIVSEQNNVNDSIKWGNYTTSELNYTDSLGNKYLKKSGEVYLIKTGSSEETKAKNIYDVAGNAYEWTMENAGNDVNVVRGGAYRITIGQLAAARYAYNDNTANSDIGFRISFYVK